MEIVIMKNFLAAALLLVSASGIAQAADPVFEDAPIAPVDVMTTHDWSGFYVGVHGGYGWGHGDTGIDDFDFDLDGGLVGAQLGYNFQTGPWVLGVETDIAYTWMEDSIDSPPFPEPATFTATLNWLGSTTGRVGYAMDRFLVYGKAGVAYGEHEIEISVPGPGVVEEETDWTVGWTAGVGAEYAFNEKLSGRLEYDYYDLGDAFDSDDYDFDAHVVKIGLNFNF
jgi:outer membrane immunogenic protein